MLNRFTQFGLAFALVSFAGLGAAQAQDEDPCMDDPCADPCGGDDPCADPCADGDPCGDPCGGDPCADGGDEGGDEAAGGEAAMGAAPPMVTPKGKLVISGVIGISLSKDFGDAAGVANPITINPDIVYGAMPKLDVGLYHSNYGITGAWYQGVAPSGVCVGDACAEAYNGRTGILAQYELVNGQLSVAGDGGLVLSNITDEADMGIFLKAGADVRYMLNEKMIIVANPSVILNLSDRDVFTDGLFVPVGLMYAVNEKLHAGVQTGIEVRDIGELADTYSIPITLAAMMKIDEKLSVGGSLGLPFVVTGGDGGPDAADFRALALFGKYAL